MIDKMVIKAKRPRSVPSRGGMYFGKLLPLLLLSLFASGVVVEPGGESVLVGEVYAHKGVTRSVYAFGSLKSSLRSSLAHPSSGCFLTAPPVPLKYYCQLSCYIINSILLLTFPR